MIGIIIAFAFFLVSSLYVASSGEFKLYDNLTINASDDLLNYDTFVQIEYRGGMHSFNFFGLLWNDSFINGVAIMTASGAVAKWYFGATKGAESLCTVLALLALRAGTPALSLLAPSLSPSSNFADTSQRIWTLAKDAKEQPSAKMRLCMRTLLHHVRRKVRQIRLEASVHSVRAVG